MIGYLFRVITAAMMVIGFAVFAVYAGGVFR